jgi:hypothetical protein
MKKIQWVEANELVSEAKKKINPINLILDVGCGIRPQTLTHTFVHICVDAHQQYLKIIKKEFLKRNKITGLLKYLCLNKTTEDIISNFPQKSVDSIFLLDVIEHLDKLKGFELINAFTKIARHQIVIFTPLGFVKQEHPDGKDAWGLDGGKWQEHKSGWTPDDFNETWDFVACKNFHQADNLGNKHQDPIGAFFAVKTMDDQPILISKKNLVAKVFFWAKSFRLYKRLKQ